MKNAIKSRSDIPNQAGFALVLVRADGSEQLAKVVKGPDGCHYCATASGKHICLAQNPEDSRLYGQSPVIGWRDYVAPIGPYVPGMVCLSAPAYYTREQVRNIFVSWGCAENPPATGKTVWVNFPPGSDFPLANVSKHENKSITGKTLFAVWFYRKAVPNLSDSGPYSTAEDSQTAKDCGLTVKQLRLDRAKEDYYT